MSDSARRVHPFSSSAEPSSVSFMSKRLLPFPDPPSPPELHVACVLVADLVGSTRLVRILPLSQYVTLMTELIQLLILHFEAHGAQVLQHQGDAVVCMWPPEASARAVLAALESHARAADLGIAALLGQHLQLRVGLAAGEVISGPVGGLPSAYGLPLNLARRLCSTALPGETLTCPAMRALVPGVALAERRVQHLAGFEDLSTVWTVLTGPEQSLLAPGPTRAGMNAG